MPAPVDVTQQWVPRPGADRPAAESSRLRHTVHYQLLARTDSAGNPVEMATEFQDAIDILPEGGVLELAPGQYKVSRELTIARKDVVIKSQIQHQAIFINNDPGAEFPQGRGATYPGFTVNTTGVVFDGVYFRGTHSPFTGINNLVSLSSSCIVFVFASDCVVRDCKFTNLWGHTVRSGFPGTQQRIHVRRCVMTDCSNGLNVNANNSEMTGNVITRCNGIETSGTEGIRIIGNTMVDSSGISLGGNGNGEDGVVRSAIVTDNIITRVWKGAGVHLSGCDACVVERNTITDASYHNTGYHGIQINDSDADNVPGWVTAPSGANYIRRNAVTMAATGAGHLLWLKQGPNTVIEDNTIVDTAGPIFAALLQDTCAFRRNACDGSTGDIAIEPVSIDHPVTVTMAGNTGTILEVPKDGSPITIVNE